MFSLRNDDRTLRGALERPQSPEAAETLRDNLRLIEEVWNEKSRELVSRDGARDLHQAVAVTLEFCRRALLYATSGPAAKWYWEDQTSVIDSFLAGELELPDDLQSRAVVQALTGPEMEDAIARFLEEDAK
jgi:hypothetical protein